MAHDGAVGAATTSVLVIGIGVGDPDHVTAQAAAAMQRADVFLVVDKGSATAEMVDLRRTILDRFVERPYRLVTIPDAERDLSGSSYSSDVAAWHGARVDRFEAALQTEVDPGGTAAFLVWGDPALYDSTLRVLDQVADRGAVVLDVSVVPGITAPQALAAAFAIPLHGVGEPVLVTTGRRLAEGWPDDVRELVVMLDGRQAFAEIDPTGIHIWWGAYLGAADQILLSGPLAEVADEIVRVRAEAKARKGWLFDTYLLRRAAPA